KGAVILPHGVLFRGNAEAEIRQNLIRRGIIKGIIGLPANLFYGTGIPACLIVLDKENAEIRKGIFMIDASKGYAKDGNKNRLREQDIHKIVDVFNKQIELPKFSRMVPVAEIEEKEFNLNIPRYIDSTEPEDIQSIESHLLGDIPNADIDALQNYWDVYPSLKKYLFKKSERAGFSSLKIVNDKIKETIFSHPEFTDYSEKVNEVYTKFNRKNVPLCKNISAETKPKKFIHSMSEDLLGAFSNLQLIDKYDVYQHLMTFWMDTMQDDCYLIVADGWAVGNEVEWTKKEFEGKLIPKQLLIKNYFDSMQKSIEQLEADRDAFTSEIEELEEEHSGEDGYFADFDKINRASVQTRLKDITAVKNKKEKNDYSLVAEPQAEYGEKAILVQYLKLLDSQAEANRKIKEFRAELDTKLLEKYKALSETEIKTLVVEGKWMHAVEQSVQTEMQRISQRLTQRIKELAERYESPLPKLKEEVSILEKKVNAHLAKMGFVWK
ncbi:MAG: N-6 DNA methylase, partial [Bacteroidota bacterium]